METGLGGAFRLFSSCTSDAICVEKLIDIQGEDGKKQEEQRGVNKDGRKEDRKGKRRMEQDSKINDKCGLEHRSPPHNHAPGCFMHPSSPQPVGLGERVSPAVFREHVAARHRKKQTHV